MAKCSFVTWILGIALLSVLGINLFLSEPKYGIRINASSSLPHKLFLRVKADPNRIEKGLIVSFHHPMGTLPLAKRVAGVPGDEISIRANRILVDNHDLGEIKALSPSGKVLTPIATGTIPEGFIFAYANHEQSFDSRYADCGLIAMKNIQDVLWPIF